MKSLPKICSMRVGVIKQRGVVLFIALIALVAMSLAAVALVRSVDTATIIAGNLAFKQSELSLQSCSRDARSGRSSESLRSSAGRTARDPRGVHY